MVKNFNAEELDFGGQASDPKWGKKLDGAEVQPPVLVDVDKLHKEAFPISREIVRTDESGFVRAKDRDLSKYQYTNGDVTHEGINIMEAEKVVMAALLLQKEGHKVDGLFANARMRLGMAYGEVQKGKNVSDKVQAAQPLADKFVVDAGAVLDEALKPPPKQQAK